MLAELIGSLKYLTIFAVIYYVVVPFCSLLFRYAIGKTFFSGRKDLIKAGKWAVVTGATDGIGKAYAHALAKDGFNIILISKTLSKLQDVAAEIQQKHNVTTKVISADFTKTDIYEDISKQLKTFEIGVLVNNVGMSYPHPIYFYDQDVLPDNFLIDMINCNCNSVVMMTRIVLPGMVARGKGGAVINVASYSGNLPTPFLSLYSASKAFVDFLSRGVEIEIGNRHNIEVQSVLPLFVATKLSKMRKAFFVPTPESYVESALGLINVESRTYGCFPHALQAFIMSLVPRFIADGLVESSMKKTMNRALRKKKSN